MRTLKYSCAALLAVALMAPASAQGDVSQGTGDNLPTKLPPSVVLPSDPTKLPDSEGLFRPIDAAKPAADSLAPSLHLPSDIKLSPEAKGDIDDGISAALHRPNANLQEIATELARYQEILLKVHGENKANPTKVTKDETDHAWNIFCLLPCPILCEKC